MKQTLLVLICMTTASLTLAQLDCLVNQSVCSHCSSDRVTVRNGVTSCCPGCGEMSLSGHPYGDRDYSCKCADSSQFVGSNWSPEELQVEGKVLSGERPPHVNSIINRPTGHRPDHGGVSNQQSGISTQLHAAISVLAEAIESLAVRIQKLENKVEHLHRDEALTLSGSNNINRVGLPENKKDKNKRNPTTIAPITTPKPSVNPSPEEHDCRGRDFVRVGGTCYYISVIDYKRADWQQASDDCIQRGAKLANLEDNNKRNKLNEYLAKTSRTAGYNYWLGGLYPGVKWLWVDTANGVTLDTRLWTYGAFRQSRIAQREEDVSDEVESNGENSNTQSLSPILHSLVDLKSKDGDSQMKSSEFMIHLDKIKELTTRTDPSKDEEIPNNDKHTTDEQSYSSKEGKKLDDNKGKVVNSFRPFPSSNSRSTDPWDVVYGRCLVNQPVGSVNGRIEFKYAAAQCGYKQYYVCESSN